MHGHGVDLVGPRTWGELDDGVGLHEQVAAGDVAVVDGTNAAADGRGGIDDEFGDGLGGQVGQQPQDRRGLLIDGIVQAFVVVQDGRPREFLAVGGEVLERLLPRCCGDPFPIKVCRAPTVSSSTST